MIKTAIKHLIYELCIDQIFNGIEKHFVPFDIKKLKVGKVYSHIHYREHKGNNEYAEYYTINAVILRMDDEFAEIKGMWYRYDDITGKYIPIYANNSQHKIESFAGLEVSGIYNVG